MNNTRCLAVANLVLSVDSVGDSYDNALAEAINGLYRTEVIWRQRSWPRGPAVGMARRRWVGRFSNHHLFGLLGISRPPRLRRTTVQPEIPSIW